MMTASFPKPPLLRNSPSPNWNWGTGGWKSADLGMESDEAHDVAIMQRVIDAYQRIHSVSLLSAEAEIRSLLEDLIVKKATVERNYEGRWRIFFQKEGYGLLLSEDRYCVVRYCTRHVERTWSQYRSGVRSRVSQRRKRTSAWIQDSIDQNMSINISQKALKAYAKYCLGLKICRDNVDEVTTTLNKYLNENVFPHLEGEEREAVKDIHGRTWVVFANDSDSRGIIMAIHSTEESKNEDD